MASGHYWVLETLVVYCPSFNLPFHLGTNPNLFQSYLGLKHAHSLTQPDGWPATISQIEEGEMQRLLLFLVLCLCLHGQDQTYYTKRCSKRGAMEGSVRRGEVSRCNGCRGWKGCSVLLRLGKSPDCAANNGR